MSGTRRNRIEVLRKQVCIPLNLCDRIDILIMDRNRNKPTFGAWSQLISELLYDFADKREKQLAEAGRQLQANSQL